MRIPHITSALIELKPSAEWTLRGDTYADLEWLDKKQTKPTEQEVEEKIAEIKYQEEVNVYQEKRKLEYPSWEDQLDQIYHSGIDVWKANIKTVKDKYPKQTMDATELQKRKDAAVFEMQKKKYIKATARLAQYELANGLKGVVGTEKVWNDNKGSGFYVDKDVIGYVIEPLPIEVNGTRNPLIVQDETERTAALMIIGDTPQAVIDSINT